MKQIAIRISEEIYKIVKRNLAETGQTMDSYLHSLVCKDLGYCKDENNSYRTLCFRLPENEYAMLKSAAMNNDITIKKFIEELVEQDLGKEKIPSHFRNEDITGNCRTVSFQIDKEFYCLIKTRIANLDMTLQDYMKSLIYPVTHCEQVDEPITDMMM